ncbi:DELTA-sagatoxin-Srs1a-like [Solea solea]|uniref:DELTA-sagatoxin-Srs1a-like n=1 Tax=Solea solea TaxID=90069 RepID=UPI00272BB822|nr:DELTA-sagatoxin-Srs1a-like [Solea solea]
MDIVDVAFAIADTVMSLGGMIAKAVPTHRQCNIEIENNSCNYTLQNPRMYTRRGRCSKPLPPTIGQSSSGEVEFKKTPNMACGSVGIFTYDLVDKETTAASEQIAVLFKVPFDHNRKSNKYAVGVFDIGKTCNRDLFQEMSKKMDTVFVRGKAKENGLSYRGDHVTIMATMSDCHTPVIKVEVSDTDANM